MVLSFDLTLFLLYFEKFGVFGFGLETDWIRKRVLYYSFLRCSLMSWSFLAEDMEKSCVKGNGTFRLIGLRFGIDELGKVSSIG